MLRLCRQLILMLCISVNSISPAVPLQLIALSYEQYSERADVLNRSFDRTKYLRAAVLAVSMGITIYGLYDLLFGPNATKKLDGVPSTKLFSLEGAQKLGWWFVTGCAQAICGKWVTRTIMVDIANPHVYIPKLNQQYKIHVTEIERLLTLRSTDQSSSAQTSQELCQAGKATADIASDMDSVDGDCADIDLLIQGHLQALVEKIERLMAYMLWYTANNTLEHTAAQVAAYVQEAHKRLERVVAQFNANNGTHFDDAVNGCKTACVELLISAMRYAKSSLPIYDHAE